ncbi:nitric oxide synthase-interacting protein homolog [Plutella xylostella]|uniref:nitric oxide synthase-interacting protein homolog n=1 Tax=Plutella xylostella TaxID=51655 RepID=UPI002032A167|nr:nitric oxide synthase-interacting protein homolog [Plutella xylostella]
MTRHARNCTAGAVYTYHEKKKDAAASGYGTQAERVGKDSVKSFDCCSLTLQPCRNPVVTKEGYLFDKEAILEYIIAKKAEYTRKLKLYEKQLKKEESEKAELAAAEKEANLIKFMNREKNISSVQNKTSTSTPSTSTSSSQGKQVPSFWIPSQLPDAKITKLEKPDPVVYCPISGRPLKMKDLIEVKWTLVKDPDDKKSLIAKENRYMCPVTHDILSNAVPCAIIRTTGDIVTMECVENLIKKDWLHPLTGDKLKEKDIIPLQRGGTGYALTNENLEGKNARPVLQA